MLVAIFICLLWVVPASATTYGTVRGGWLRLRAEPSYQAYVITSYPTGTVVTILSQASGWCQVVTPDRRLGYMDQRYLTISGSYSPSYIEPTYPTYPTYPSSSGWYNVNQTGYVTSANGKGVRLRRAPVVNGYNVLGLYPVGRTLTILKRNNSGWSYVRIGSQEGYMMSQFITTSYYPVPTYYPGPTPDPYIHPTRTPSYRYTAYLTTDNGRSIYLRRDASMNFQYIAEYPVGTQVTVLGTEGAWTHVIVNGLEGYVQSIYVTSRRPSAPAPTSGIPYYPDPVEEPIYVDPVDDSSSQHTNPVPPNVYGITSVRLTNTSPRVGDLITVVVAPSSAEFTAYWFRDDNAFLTTGNRYTVKPEDVGHVIYVRITGTGAYSGTMVEAMTSAVRAGTSTATPIPMDVIVPEWVDEVEGELPEATPIPDSYYYGMSAPDSSVVSEWVDDPSSTPVVIDEWVEDSSDSSQTVVEWVDPTPIDSWWTDDSSEMVTAEWVDP